MVTGELRLDQSADGAWMLSGPGVDDFALVNEYLGYLSDRNYSPRTARAYGFDLLALCRGVRSQDIGLSAVTTEVLLDFMRACREAK